jgi:hypothetical protein
VAEVDRGSDFFGALFGTFNGLLPESDGTVIELERISQVGFSARVAALYDYMFSLIRTLPEEAFRPDPDRAVRYFDVPVRRIKVLLGIRRFGARTFRYITEVLAAQFRYRQFASSGEGVKFETLFAGVACTRGRKAVLIVGVREHVFRLLREGNVQTLSFPAEALVALARASNLAAALARWLAVHFQGDAYVNVPLRVPVVELYRYCHGESDGDPRRGPCGGFNPMSAGPWTRSTEVACSGFWPSTSRPPWPFRWSRTTSYSAGLPREERVLREMGDEE